MQRDRQAFLEEKRRADVDDVLAQLPNTPSAAAADPGKPSSEMVANAAASGSSVISIHADVIIPHPPPTSPWAAHRPLSPSPLSPHKVRTPKAHLAKNKRAKTPLSRLVLEKAVRRKSLLAAAATVGSEPSADNRGVLGESSKRVNATEGTTNSAPTRPQAQAQLGVSIKGKEKARTGTAGDVKSVAQSRAPVGKSSAQSLHVSVGGVVQAKSLGASQRRAAIDLSKSSGMGPKSVTAKGAWR